MNIFSHPAVRTSALRLFAILPFAWWAIIVTPAICPAQEQQRGFQPGAAYSISDIESINQENGNMMLTVPLASLPAGRGGVPGPSVSLIYNSKLYDTHAETIPDPSLNQDVNVTFLNPSDMGGWHYNFQSFYYLLLESRTNIEGSYPCECGSDYGKNAYIWKLKVVFPDGGEHVLRPLNYTDIYQDGYFNIDPNGVVSNAGCASLGGGGSSCTYGTSQATTAGMTYYSTDGTFLRLFVPFSQSGGWQSNWTLSFNDGSRLVAVNGVRTMYDRNNNIIPFGFGDDLGRSITFTSQANEDHISITGANGNTLEWIVKWKTVFVSRSYISTVASSGQERGNSFPQTMLNEERVVDQIILPSQAGSLTYTFGYSASSTDPYPQESPGWGELNAITLPGGAQVHYDYAFDGNGGTPAGITPKWNWVLNNRPIRKLLTYLQEYDGNSTSTTEAWVYNQPPLQNSGGFFSSIGPDGTTTASYSYSDPNHPFVGHAYKTDYPDGSVTERVWKQNRPQGIPLIPKAVNPFVQREFHSVTDAAGNLVKTAIKEYKYDKNGNQTQVDEYDWVDYSSLQRDVDGNLITPVSAPLKRRTINTYYNPTPDAEDSTTNSQNVYYTTNAPSLRTAIKDTEISSGGAALARTEFFYDNASTSGNLITQKSWDSQMGAYSNPLTVSNSIAVSTAYNQYGSPTLTTDARGVKTRVVYGQISNVSDLYPTEINNAFETSVQRTERREYDFATGLVKKVTDADNNVSTSTQYDDLGRPTLVRAGENTADETQTATQYFDSERRVVMLSDLNTTGDGLLATVQHYDQLGRIRLTRQLEEAPTTGNLAAETAGIKVQTRYIVVNPCAPDFTYICMTSNASLMVSFVLTSNPFRASTSTGAGSETTMGWSRSKSNYLGRLVEVQTFAGTGLPAPWGSNSSSTGTVSTAYDGLYTTVTDQAGKLRRSKVDALGRLIRVDEASDVNNTLGLPDSPTQATSYDYDPLGNLIQVTQGAQHRYFSYNSLSRLKEATNPESGTISYLYDKNGNLSVKTDPRLLPNSSTHVSKAFVYDELNRLSFRTYNDGTPNVSYSYDASGVPNSRGRLTGVTSSVSAYTYSEYDALGRVKTGTQTTDGQNYTMVYSYNRAGAMISQTYPSGRVVKTEYDAVGRIAGVKNNATGAYYAGAVASDATNRFQYSAAGAVQAMKLGNGLWEHTNFNSRLQVTQIGLGTSSADSSKLKLDYAYGVLNGSVLDTTKNNGNVQSQTITLPGITAILQNYEYDELNRLKVAQEVGSSGWTEQFVYDRFGNRNGITVTDNPSFHLPTAAPEVDPNTNKFKLVNSQSQTTGFDYDVAGNLIQEPEPGTSTFKEYFYDAENHLTQAKRKNGSIETDISSYLYDGDGRRVKTTVGSIHTIYVYAISGQMIAEYSENPTGSAGTSYVTGDMLGSTRLVTGSEQSIKERRDYLPYGEEVPAGYNNRTAVAGYGNGKLRQQFTLKERDIETGLDYFGARYYASAQGRFTSPDEFKGGPEELSGDIDPHDPLLYADIAEPQSLNKYQYALNNPLRYVDPDGHQTITADKLKRAAADATKPPVQVAQCAVNIQVGLWKAAGNTLIGASNIGAIAMHGKTTAPFRENGANCQYMSMHAGEVLLLVAPLAEQMGPANLLVAESEEATKATGAAVTFDEARLAAFEKAGMTNPSEVKFTKVDPKTGTVVEFKGGLGAKVAYDGPHAGPGQGHDSQHVGWQAGGKRGQIMGGKIRGNIPYRGPQHPSRSPIKGEGVVEPH